MGIASTIKHGFIQPHYNELTSLYLVITKLYLAITNLTTPL